MTLNAEVLALLLGIVSLIGTLWKIFNSLSTQQAATRAEIWQVRESLEKKDLLLEALQNQQLLAVNQTRERIEHVTGRLQKQQDSFGDRLGAIEAFLAKTTAFQVRGRS